MSVSVPSFLIRCIFHKYSMFCYGNKPVWIFLPTVRPLTVAVWARFNSGLAIPMPGFVGCIYIPVDWPQT